MSISDWAGGQVFKIVHGHNLVYNTCWEDPRLDHQALKLTPSDTVLVITSAGCNALDYALVGPKQVVAVDMNPRQNALLELKLAGIRGLEFEDFFAMFGNGHLPNTKKVYEDKLRPALRPWTQRYWDRWIKFFDPSNRRPFYFRGTSGAFAMLINAYFNRVMKLRPRLNELLECATLDEQQELYSRHLRNRIWTRSVRFAMRRDTVLSLLGVPRPQRHQIETQYAGGINQFVRDCLDAVFGQLSLVDNYFWRVYLTGRYTPQCCPEYLKPDNFQKLRDGQAERVETHTDSVEGFLAKDPRPISRFVLLDHMDWLSTQRLPWLAQEWRWIVRRAAPGARILWRSAGLRTEFVDRTRIDMDGRTREVGELVVYDRALAEQLHPQCRVHTYGSFHIADLAA